MPGGLLGADYEIDERPLPLQEGLRRPELEPGAALAADRARRGRQGGRVPAGRRRQRPEAARRTSTLFENTAGKSIEITVGPNADGKGTRTVTVEPIASESRCATATGSRATCSKVDEATERAAWPTSTCRTPPAPGHAYFKRYFFPQADKEAMIIDERFNGGGQVADYYIDLLRRPLTAYWATRYGADMKTPSALDPRAEGDAHRRDGRLRAATCCRGCSASSSSARSSASGPGAAWSASSASRC